jgi:murein L,D-transpeptidase YcbB/YkuD
VIFPTWTVPSSIIKKEMLPGLKKNSNYLARKGLQLYSNKGELVDPSTINWAKYSKGIPYKIQQGSGDDNALGVIKFNFNNPFDVYLHDTNQRYLFKNGMRALSHGCVRVQDWEKLAFYIARNDSLKNEKAGGDTLKYNTDSITNWIDQKERHRIDIKYKIPLFIRYFSCEALNGAIKFYDDIYDEDKKMKDKFFGLK